MMIKVLVFIFCSIVLIGTEAKAQLFLEQGKLSLAVSDAERSNGSVTLHNTSSDPVEVKVYWEDFEYKSPYDGTKNFSPAGTGRNSASKWVAFTPQVFTIPAFGRQKIDYTLTVPDTITEGHYGVLFFESNGAPMAGDKGVTLVTRVGCLFFIEPKQKNKKSDIQDIKSDKKGFTVNFVNQGNIVLIPKTTYYVMEDEGLVVSRGETEKLYVPPGVSASLEIPLKSPLKEGRYTLVINSDLEEGDVVIKEVELAVDAGGQVTISNPNTP